MLARRPTVIDTAWCQATGEPLFSSHMLDLSEEPHEENIGICAKYLERPIADSHIESAGM